MSFQDITYSSAKYADIVIPLIEQRGIEYKIKRLELGCCCPFHEETKPSFGINLETGQFNCFSCEAHGSIVDFVAKMKGITNSEAWKEIKEKIGDFEMEKQTLKSYTLEMYAEEKKLNLETLKGYNIKTADNGTSIAIPYYDENGNFVRTRFRNGPDNENRFIWSNDGEGTTLYGLWAINNFKQDYIILVEGESDCHSLWSYGFQAIGVPGAKNFKKEYAKYFTKFDRIYIHNEGDDGGKVFVNSISKVLPVNKLYVIKSSSVDSNCKDPSDLHINGKLNIQALLNTASPIVDSSLNANNNGEEVHVVYGKKLIDALKLRSLNGQLYSYTENGVFTTVEDSVLKNYLLHHIDINLKNNKFKEIMDFVYNWLANSENLTVNKDYINYRNGLFSINERKLIPHTEEIFTVNQLPVDYIENFIPHSNEFIDNYIANLMSYKEERIIALLQVVGYIQTSKTDIQQAIILYGPSASNGKSTFCKILVKMVGEENTSAVELQQYAKRFGSHEISNKILNLVSELPVTKVKDVATFKAAVTGDTFYADIKYKGRQKIKAYAKNIFTTNNLPQVDDTTDGFYRRLCIIPFEQKYEKSTKFNINEYLIQENLNYLANLGLIAYLDLLDSGKLEFSNKEESSEYIELYKKNNDTVLSFLTDEDSMYDLFNRDIRTVDTWKVYKEYCKDNLLSPISRIQFYEQLEKKYNFVKKKINGYDYFYADDNVKESILKISKK